MLDTFLVLS